ncbi:transmembrane protein [Rhynchospora pubera]|uniref:Transmembrane protein n=1 Tax=Rhynchospora pubera TaxID=906938 RepID=A0AAV8FR52_9POAL|nr:transmembrane protein [Rhynchospora pubera]KAJ4817120.1 transmembrane protein [Rhynchospora pubera]
MGRFFSSLFRGSEIISLSSLRSIMPSSSTFRQLPGFNLSVVRRAVSRFPELDFSILDSVMWSIIMAFESVALVAMMGFFFLFCGCTLTCQKE